MVAVIAFPFMIVVTHQSMPIVYVDQGQSCSRAGYSSSWEPDRLSFPRLLQAHRCTLYGGPVFLFAWGIGHHKVATRQDAARCANLFVRAGVGKLMAYSSREEFMAYGL